MRIGIGDIASVDVLEGGEEGGEIRATRWLGSAVFGWWGDVVFHWGFSRVVKEGLKSKKHLRTKPFWKCSQMGKRQCK